MTWAKLSDAFYDDPDTDRLSLTAVAAYCLILSWCGKHETDGHVSEDRVVLLARGKRSVIPELLAENAKGEAFLVRNSTGLMVRNWSKYQPTREQMKVIRKLQEQEREATTKRVQKHRRDHTEP
jgi:uncharacterized protein YdaU (DUF1376 family)